MTGATGRLTTLSLAAAAACVAMLGQAVFGFGFPLDARLNGDAGGEAQYAVSETGAEFGADAGVSAAAQTSAEGSIECIVDCPAPCATACATASSSVEGAAELRSGFSAEVAPEHSDGAQAGVETGAGFESEGSFEAGAVSGEGNGSLSADVEFVSGVTFEAD